MPNTLTTEAETKLASVSESRAVIAELANQLWVARGCPTGSAEIDWYAAEAELQRRRQQMFFVEGTWSWVAPTLATRPMRLRPS